MDKMPAIIVDIDGTIADISHRIHFIEGDKKDWDGFYQNLSEDKPKQDIIDLIKILDNSDYFHILLVTGRSEKYAGLTARWIRHNCDFETQPEIDSLYMRKDGDFRQDYEIKKEIYEKEIKDMYDVKYVFEDRDQVVKMYRELGLTVLQVANGNF